MKLSRYSSALPVFLMLFLGCFTVPVWSQSPTLSDWITEATQQSTSPVVGQVISGDLTKTWTGANDATLEAVVLQPRVTSGMTINLTAVPGDNGPAIASALSTLAQAGGGQLNLAAGTYTINGTNQTTPSLSINQMHDVTISGTGATLLMLTWGTGINISYSQRIHIVGVTIRYQDPAIVTGTIVQIGSGLGVNFNPVPVQENGTPNTLNIFQVTTLNPQGSGYSITGTRFLSVSGGALFTTSGGGNYAPPAGTSFTGFNVGDKVAVKLTYYLGAATVVNDSGSSSNPPASSCKLEPVTQADGTTSIAYDGIHLSAFGGDAIITSNQIIGTGDDAVNMASPILAVGGPGTMTGTVKIAGAGNIVTGETISLFDAQMNYLGSAAESSRTATVNGYSTVTFASPGIANSQNALFAREGTVWGSRYAVSGNTISNCDCHGVLAQLPNGLVSSNTISGLRYNAIRLITSGAWSEGTGALNVVVTNNTISNTGADTKEGFVWAAITAYGEIKTANSNLTQMTSGPVNGTLVIKQNTVQQTQDACLSFGDTINAELETNTCTSTMLGGPSQTGSFASYPGSDTVRAEGIFIDPATTTNITVSP